MKLPSFASLAAVLIGPALVLAQADPTKPAFRLDAGGFKQPKPKMEAAGRVTSTTPAPFVPAYVPPVNYGGYGGYPIGVMDPNYGFLSGAANVINAQGQYRIADQQSNVVREQARQAKIDTQRKAFDEWNYERALTPNIEDQRMIAQMESLRRARNEPTATEIWTGAPLNDLMSAITKAHRTGMAGPMVPLSQEVLNHVNFTSGTTTRGSGLLKGSDLRWPASLTDTVFDKTRNQVDALIRQAMREAGDSGQINGKVLRDLDRSLSALEDQVRDNAKEMTVSDSLSARRYVRELKDSCAVLKDPEPARALGLAGKPKASSVGELVDQMNAKGLRFGAAVSGDEAAYRALHQAMATYDYQTARMAGQP